jgi:chromosome segregation ATPase
MRTFDTQETLQREKERKAQQAEAKEKETAALSLSLSEERDKLSHTYQDRLDRANAALEDAGRQNAALKQDVDCGRKKAEALSGEAAGCRARCAALEQKLAALTAEAEGKSEWPGPLGCGMVHLWQCMPGGGQAALRGCVGWAGR